MLAFGAPNAATFANENVSMYDFRRMTHCCYIYAIWSSHSCCFLIWFIHLRGTANHQEMHLTIVNKFYPPILYDMCGHKNNMSFEVLIISS